jgi:hypothetical protein
MEAGPGQNNADDPPGPTIQTLEIETHKAESLPAGETAGEAERMRSTPRSQRRSRLAGIHFAFLL